MSTVLKQNELDMLDLSTIDKDADLKVTKDEYDLWQQEAQMKDFVEKMQTQARLDMSGHDSEDVAILLDKISDFQKTFEESYLNDGNGVASMAKAFKEAFPAKYKEIREFVLKNSKTAVKQRVIDNLLNELSSDASKGGRSMMGIVDNGNLGLSDKAKMVLQQSLSKEADRFIKKYSGDNLEADLLNRLKTFLSETDRDKLADSIKAWTKVKGSFVGKDDKSTLNELKSFAKNFLTEALSQGLTLKFAGTTIRTVVVISPLLSQFNNPEKLKNAIEDCISQISTQTVEQKARGVQPVETDIKESGTNFFKVDSAENNIFG